MPSVDQHSSPEQLVAYHERRLATDESEEVRAHLVTCADCTTQLLELADLLDGDGDGAARTEISHTELDAAWQRQQERLPSIAPVVSLEERRAGKAPRHWSWATAASLGIAATLAFVVVAQWRTIEHLRQPRANPPLVNLVPADSLRRGSGEVSDFRFSEGSDRAWVILNPDMDLGSALYDVQIIDAKDKPVLGLQSFPDGEAGTLRLDVPRAALKPGSYKILLFRAGEHRIVEEFELEVLP